MRSPPKLSERAKVALVGFGIDPRDPARAHRSRVAASEQAAGALIDLPSPRVIFVTGPSGAGKSTLLEALARNTPVSRSLKPDRLRSPRCLIDWVHRDPAVAMRWLAACGLAEARAFLTPVRALSTGQRARAVLARALGRTRRRMLVCDEFAAGLDGATSRSACKAFTRAARRAQRTLIAVSADERLTESLSPDTLVYVSVRGEIEITHREPGDS